MIGLTQESIDNYHRFLSEAIKTKRVWVMVSPEDQLAFCPANKLEAGSEEPLGLLPVWSDAPYAEEQIKENWSDHKVKPVELASFINIWSKMMHEEGILIGPNWTAHLAGAEIEPLELAKQLTKKLEEAGESAS